LNERAVPTPRGWKRLLAGGVAAVVIPFGCDGEQATPVVVDEQRGVLHGVQFGDDAEAVQKLRGRPDEAGEGVFPEGADYTGPPAIPSPRSDQRPPRAPTPLHYGDSAYLVSPSVGVFSMSSLEDEARTRAGVGVGDALKLVRVRYGEVDCGEAVAGEPLFGGETPTYPWCRAIVGPVRVFFGGDPIASITLTSYSGDPLAGAARRFDRHPLYWVGERFERWELEHFDAGNFVTFVYGRCEPGEAGGCPPPLEIQIQPLCAHLEVVARAPIWRRRSVRGAPVGTIDSAPVLFTNRVQVKVYRGEGSDPGLPMRALRALRSANEVEPVIGAGDPIPPAPRAILSGSRRCEDGAG
jgi:hypothetical protein